MALGGVEIGSMNAKELAIAVGIIKANGFTAMLTAFKKSYDLNTKCKIFNGYI